MDSNQPRKGFVALGLLLAFGLIAAAGLVSWTFYSVKQLDNTLSVTGSARQHVTSDTVKWTAAFSRSTPADDLKGGYAAMKADEKKIMDFLASKGIPAEAVTVQPVSLDEPFKYNPSMPREYSLRQTVEVRSGDIQGVTSVAKDFQPLIEAGVVFSTQSLEYSYSKLPDLRVSLLSAAVQDAQARAGKIAESTGRQVGMLRSASMGVVQVLPVGSVEVSDYGAYDTSGIEKEVMVTVRTAFALR